MDNIIDFKEAVLVLRGCANCQHCARIGKGDYMCNELEFDNGDKIYPITDSKQTDDYYACNGGSFVKVERQYGSKREKAVKRRSRQSTSGETC